MKTPKPWYWKARKAWYVQIDKKQIRLHENEKEAHKEFYRIMAAGGKLGERETARMTVADAVEALCSSSGVTHCRANTRQKYVYNLGPFAAAFATRRLDQLSPEDITCFVSGFPGRTDGKRGFGDASRHMMFRHIKTLYRWARDTGVIATNPMHGVKNPWHVASRPRTMTEEEYRLVMADLKPNSQFKEFLEFLWTTGARPGEIACLEARHLDPRRPIVRLRPGEHKTGSRTGLDREIILPPELMEKLKRYAADRPKGRLLRTKRGDPWNAKRASECFCRIKRRLKLPDELVLYMTRHSFVTRMLASGVKDVIVAKLAGHIGTDTIQKVYYHPDTDVMIAAVEAMSRPDAPPDAETISRNP